MFTSTYNNQIAVPFFRGDLYPYLISLGEITENNEGEVSLTGIGGVVGGGRFKKPPQIERDILNCISNPNPYKCCISAIGNWRRAQPANKLQTICDMKEMKYQDCLEQVDNPKGCEEEIYGRYPGDPTRQECIEHREKYDREVGDKYNQYDKQCADLYLPKGGGGGETTTA